MGRVKGRPLADRIVEFDLGVISEMSRRFGGRIHGFTFTADRGTERATFISPALWRDFFQPRCERVFEACHRAARHVWMHTWGWVDGIIDGLIGIGLNAANLQQSRVLGVEKIGERFRGRMCFSSLCDVQVALPAGDESAIREEAGLFIENWSTPEGGFIPSDYGDGEAIGVPLEAKEAMLEASRAVARWCGKQE